MVSIIVPVFNSENTLRRCLDSILSQTFKNYEIICVNDGSTDRSLAILSEYSKKNPCLTVVSKENGGLSSARNAGLRIATGKFIGFVDSDDYINPVMFEQLITESELSGSCLIGCGTEVIYQAWESSRKTDDKYFSVKLGRNVLVTPGVFSKMDVHVWNKLFRSDLIKQFQIKFPEGLNYEDAPFVINYLCVCKSISFFKSKLYYYVRSEGSIMGETFKKTPKALDHVRVVDFTKEFLLKNNLEDRLRKDVADFSVKNYFSAIKFCPNNLRVKAFLLIISSLRQHGFINSLYVLLRLVVIVSSKCVNFLFV